MSEREKTAWRSAENQVKFNWRQADGWWQNALKYADDPVRCQRAVRVWMISVQIYRESKQQLEDYEAGKISAEEVLLCGQDKLAHDSIKAGLTSRAESGIVLA